jgi:hypothetical protein
MPDLIAGQTRLPYVDLDTHDGTTAGTVTIRNMSTGAETSSSSTRDAETGRLTATASYVVAAGLYRERWTVTGTGATVAEVWVSVAPSGFTSPPGRVYATPADYATVLQEAPPVGIIAALASAGAVVAGQMLKTSVYAVDEDGYPTDAAHIEAIKVATCQQARWRADKDKARYKSGGFSIGKIAVQKPGPATVTAGVGPRGEWAADAWATLDAAGLTGHEPWGY